MNQIIIIIIINKPYGNRKFKPLPIFHFTFIRGSVNSRNVSHLKVGSCPNNDKPVQNFLLSFSV